MTAQACNCCKEEIHPSKVSYIDGDYGMICPDCYDGMVEGKELLKQLGVEGVFRGRCPDNERREA